MRGKLLIGVSAFCAAVLVLAWTFGHAWISGRLADAPFWPVRAIVFLFDLCFAGCLLCLVFLAIRTIAAPRKRAQPDWPVCAKCGYDLRGLAFQRCPECGTLRGFTVGPKEAGLTDEEINAAERKQKPAGGIESASPGE